MASSGRLAVACMVLAAGSMAGSVFAQAPSAETGRILAPGETLDTDVVRIYGGANLEHHTNIFRLADGVDPTPLFGKGNRSDTLLIGNAGVLFDRELSRQRLRLEARLNPVKYFTYSKFDYLGYFGAAKLDWAVGSALYGDVGARLSEVQTSFIGANYGLNGQNFGGDVNRERRNYLFFTGGLRMTPNWSVFGHFDHENLDNSLNIPQFQAANNRVTGTEAGVRYEPGTGSEIALLGRHQTATYPTNQTLDLFGNVLATPISNDYKQNAALFRVKLSPNEDTRLTGDFGYTRREYNSVSSRNFSGPTAKLVFDWRAGPGFFMSTELIRDLANANVLTANYIDFKGVNVKPTVVLTGKININGLFSYGKVGWKGDPGLVAGTQGGREDTLTIFGAALVYEYSRVLSATTELRREHRSSNVAGADYGNTILSAGIQARF